MTLERLFGTADDWTRRVRCLESFLDRHVALFEAGIRELNRRLYLLDHDDPANFRAIDEALAQIRRAEIHHRVFDRSRIRLWVMEFMHPVAEPGHVLGFSASVPSLALYLAPEIESFRWASQRDSRQKLALLAALDAASDRPMLPAAELIRILVRAALELARPRLESPPEPASRRPGAELIARVLAIGGGAGAFALRC